jgi:sulfur transfer protein SufE
MLPPAADILQNFELLEEGHDQFEYLMELGRMLPPLPAADHTDAKLVPGCQSRVWLGQHITSKRSNGLRSMVERIRGEAGRVAAAA